MNKVVWIAIGSAVVAAGSLAMSVVTGIRNRMVIKKIEKSIEKVEEVSEEKISEAMIEKAVNKAATGKVTQYMNEVENSVLRGVKEGLQNAAKDAVDKNAEYTRDEVTKEISKQVADLDVEQLKARVCSQAEKHVLKKLDGCMDEYAKDFRDQLDSTKKIVDRISTAMIDKEKKDNDFHVVLI
jgi:hypothetical protein